MPPSVGWLTMGLATAALLAAGASAALRGAGAQPGLPLASVAALLACLTAAGCLQLRFSHRDHVEALDLFDAVLAPLVFFLPGPTVVVVAALAVVGCDVILRTRPVKAVFNVAQWTAAAGAGALCYAAVAGGQAVSARNLGALALAMGVVGVVNHLAMVAVLSLVTPGPVGAVLSAVSPLVRMGWVVAGAVNLAFGLLMVTALATGAWAVVLFVVPLGMLHWASRGYAEARADHARLGGLQRATHALAGPIDPRDAIGEFLAEVRDCFAVEVAELLLPEGGTYRVQRLAGDDPAGVRSWALPVQAPSLAVDLLNAGRTTRVTAGHPDEALRSRLAEEGWRDCLGAPLVVHGLPQGLLCVYDRTGLEGFEAGETAVLEALARELAGALEKAELVEEVLHQALHDSLTALPNRTLFHQRVQRAIAAASHTDARVAVMLIDLNRFKEVNDTLGHHNGDLLLQDLGRRLRHSVRPGDTVARLGGDEFAIVVPRAEGVAGAERVAARVLRSLEEPFSLNDLTLDVDAAIGIALYPDHGRDPATLLQRADVAMYAAKGGQGGYEVYNPENDRYSPERLALVGELRSAPSNGQLQVHYQPKSDLDSGRVTGLEALLRWEHPVHGTVPPDEFIPMAEQTGSIRALTSFVLEEALTQCAAWRRAGLDVGIAVNLSVRSLLDPGLPDEVGRLLAGTGLPAGKVTLELTESSMMADPQRTADVLARLNLLGVQLSIDDFGTGYSSLSYLRRLPVDEMKIDKSFVMSMAHDDGDDVIVRSTVDLGHNLGLRVVAEGVEDEASWRRLRALGCDSAQGYFLSRPLPAGEVEALVARLGRGPQAAATGATAS
ncbi:MAG: putative bifunctional diguanylate cyclase/phosphodiesterase [Acidimicrobiales bacterium]